MPSISVDKENNNDNNRNKCSIKGCNEHIGCPECARKRNEKIKAGRVDGDDGYSEMELLEYIPNPKQYVTGVEYWTVKCGGFLEIGSIDIYEEQPDWPNDSGYVDCWICKKTICNNHFKIHYQKCRDDAAHRCGFRARTDNNHSSGETCVPGHCGKNVDPMNVDYCYSADAVCGTVCCSECKNDCPDGCGKVHCKEHASQYCLDCSWR